MFSNSRATEAPTARGGLLEQPQISSFELAMVCLNTGSLYHLSYCPCYSKLWKTFIHCSMHIANLLVVWKVPNKKHKTNSIDLIADLI